MIKYDLIIIGGGAAGFAAAMKANELGAKILMVNNNSIGLGGTCVNVGCVPTKYLLNIGALIHTIQKQQFDGVSSSTSYDYTRIIEGKNKLIDGLREDKYEKVLKNLSNVEFVEGNANFISDTQILVNNQDSFEAKKLIIATGSSTFIPPIEGIQKVNYLTNITALQLKQVPTSLIVLGGGALGLEFAQLFSRFGAKVYLLEMMENIITNEEPEVSNFLFKYLTDEEIEIYTQCKVIRIEGTDNKVIIQVNIEGKDRSFESEKILFATGRSPNTRNLGLEKIHANLGKKDEIIVDKFMKASRNIWAAGDVTGEPMLETVAAREGMIAANNALSDNKIKMDYRVIPHAIFTDPQVGSVGLTDLEANEKGFTCSCRTIPIDLVPKSGIIKDSRGVVKMVINNETEEILGIHILATGAADLIHEGTMIIKNRMKLNDVINTIHVFPTLSEAIKLAAQSFKRDISNMTCCAE